MFVHLKPTFVRFLTLSVVLTVSLSAVGQANMFDEFRCQLTGHWDNEKQATADAEQGLSGMDLHPRRAMTYVPIANDDIEGQLFAILSYAELGFDGPLGRVALHRFRPVDDSEVVHEFLFPKEPERWGDLSQDLAPLMQIQESDVHINDKCVMHWRRLDDTFDGRTVKGQCVTSSFTPEPILVEGHGVLSKELLLRHDQNFSMEGESLPIPGGASPERFEKVDRMTYAPGLLKNIAAISRPLQGCE